MTKLSRKSRVVTQIKPLFSPVPEDLLRQEAKACFWTFRRCIHPAMKLGWFQQKTANDLLQFYYDYKSGKRPKLVMQSPPQHGKSQQARDFLAWLAGRDPDLKVIFASYSDELCTAANIELQRTFLSPLYQRIFYKTRVRQQGEYNQ